MEKVKKYLNIALFASLLAACWAEFILCFARGYEELWYTILVPSVIVTVLAAFALKTRFKWLYFIGTAVVLVGAVLLIGFPSYVMYVALVCGGLSLVAEVFLLALFIKERKGLRGKSD